MDFGRLSDLRGVDFTLPPDHPETATLLARARAAAPPQPAIYVGCPIWTNKAWLGSYFPAGIKDADYLHHYARQFNSIELNTTHYRIPDAPTVRKWRDAVPPGFKFCPKMPQSITHERELYNADELTTSFCRAISGLEEHLGPAFLQLPPTFGPEHMRRLERYLLDFPAYVPLAVELRHPRWFADVGVRDTVFALLEALNKTLVITDVAGRRDVLHQRLTTPTAFIRFNGHGLGNSDYRRADAWAERVAGWLSAGLHTAYIFIHQKDIMHSPIWTQYFLEKLRTLTGLEIAPPKVIVQPVQGSLF
ncbi:hypothetical protein GCM10011375_13120 [Hymenobacter qilianensis]|uniref:Uncharacterized protein n=1 Tax=Hymenobacter qilianensis TaxID=1385715 RepID=A0ACB5PPI5_9BACT|nr:DUF72 domain-containing protein [Hymenobacter qilianensis]GGF59302.1 hypothetical protein GCM10011375_13120 [Hymenobacter qilianensis]